MLPEKLQRIIEEIYADNSFMKLCGLKIDSLSFGEAKVSLRIDDRYHTNTNHKVHGGLVLTMMDNATGLAGCTAGKKLVTASTSASLIKSAGPGDELEATARIEEAHKEVYHLRMKVINKGTGELLALGTSAMIAVCDIPGGCWADQKN